MKSNRGFRFFIRKNKQGLSFHISLNLAAISKTHGKAKKVKFRTNLLLRCSGILKTFVKLLIPYCHLLHLPTVSQIAQKLLLECRDNFRINSRHLPALHMLHHTAWFPIKKKARSQRDKICDSRKTIQLNDSISCLITYCHEKLSRHLQRFKV